MFTPKPSAPPSRRGAGEFAAWASFPTPWHSPAGGRRRRPPVWCNAMLDSIMPRTLGVVTCSAVDGRCFYPSLELKCEVSIAPRRPSIHHKSGVLLLSKNPDVDAFLQDDGQVIRRCERSVCLNRRLPPISHIDEGLEEERALTAEVIAASTEVRRHVAHSSCYCFAQVQSVPWPISILDDRFLGSPLDEKDPLSPGYRDGLRSIDGFQLRVLLPEDLPFSVSSSLRSHAGTVTPIAICDHAWRALDC
jgi:hypothetical protein